MAVVEKLEVKSLRKIANQIRRHIVMMASRANASHSGSALSPVEMVTALYFQIMRIDPKKSDWPDRDRFILSKGHGGAVLYAALAERGFFPVKLLDTFCLDDSLLPTHPVFGKISGVPGVEATTGSLGHGLAMGLGMALAGKHDKKDYQVYVMISDGECDEGSVWEGLLYAGAKKVDNLIIFIDYNKIQSFGRTAEVLDLEPLKDKLLAFNWDVQEIDGHDFSEIISSVKRAKNHSGQPHCIIAHTVKGKGISYMEDKLEWHYRSPSGDLLAKALSELEEDLKSVEK